MKKRARSQREKAPHKPRGPITLALARISLENAAHDLLEAQEDRSGVADVGIYIERLAIVAVQWAKLSREKHPV